MPQTTLATLNTANVNDDFRYRLLSVNNRIALLGQWEFGMAAAGNKTSLEGLPDFSAPEGSTDRVRRDVEKANGLLVIQPRKVFEAFKAARNVTIFLYREESRLTGKGYRDEAKVETIKPTVDSAFLQLDTSADDAFAASKRVDELADFIRSDFPKTGESDFQEVIFDAAIIARTEPMAEFERAMLIDKLMPPRFNDARLIQALYRTPSAMHGLDPETMKALQDVYAAVAWPRTAQAIGMLAEMVASARAALASAVMTAAYVSSVTSDVAFARVKKGAWLREVRNQTLGISKGEMERSERLARLAAGDFTQEA